MSNPFEKLGELLKDSTPASKKEKRSSKKESDIFVRDFLEENPRLKEQIISICQLLNKLNSELPLIHITSSQITEDGKGVSTGFLENIKQNGLQNRNTNVGVFVKRGFTTERAKPKDYIDSPEDFIKSIDLFLQRYGHHGIRTNKSVLGEKMNSGKGKPVMLIIDGNNTKLEKASDYDDHYILNNGDDINPNKLIGEIDIPSPQDYKKDLAEILNTFLEKIKQFYNLDTSTNS